MSNVESVPSSIAGNQAEVEVKADISEPPLKKKRECKNTPKDLQSRLWTVLACTVCFDLPTAAIYQCQHGHLMCNGCFNHLLADARLKNEQATCPTCRIEIGQFNCSRNLAVEKAVSELPGECKFCLEEFPRHQITWHENELCTQRTVKCRYAAIGCTWSEKCCLKEEHEERCVYPSKTGADLMDAIATVDKKQREENQQLRNIVRMMSCEKIAICDIQLSPSRTDDYIPRLYYETNRFSAFEQTWVIKAKIVGDEKSCDRKLMYQVCLRGKTNVEVKYLLLKGPFGSSEINPDLHRFEFKEDNKETDYHTITLASSPDCNRLLAARTINIRLLMFLISKG